MCGTPAARRLVRGPRDAVHGLLLFVMHARALLPLVVREILVVLRPHVDPLRLIVEGRGDVAQVHHIGVSAARGLNDLGLSLLSIALAILEFLEFLVDAAETGQFEGVPHRERPAVRKSDARVLSKCLLDVAPRLLLPHVRRQRLEIATFRHLNRVSLLLLKLFFQVLQSRGQELLTYSRRHPVDSGSDDLALGLELRSILRVDERALSRVVLAEALGSRVDSPRQITVLHGDRHLFFLEMMRNLF